MQSAKDTFLMTLRDRLAIVNPSRMVAVRGAMRPAVVAEENELPEPEVGPLDCFVLRWVDVQRDGSEPLPVHAMRCEIRYATRGSAEFAGMDRGRVAAAMDAELRAMLEPRSAALMDYTATPAVAMTTRVFWSEMEPAVVTSAEDRMQALVRVTVFALEEAG